MKILDSLNWRYATKIFDKNKKISDKDFKIILESLKLTPSSFWLQPWKFLVIKNPEIREKLKEHSWNQSQVTDSSHLIVICRKDWINENYIDHFLESTAEIRGAEISSLSSYKKLMIWNLLESKKDLDVWAKNQCYIALWNLLTVCAAIKIDACPIEWFDPAKYDEILWLKDKWLKSSLVCPVGYRSEEDKYWALKKVRFDLDELVVEV